MTSQEISEKKKYCHVLTRQSCAKATLGNTHSVLGGSSESQVNLTKHKSAVKKNCSYYQEPLWLRCKSGDKSGVLDSHFLMSVFLVMLKKELEYPEVLRKKAVQNFCRDVLKVNKCIKAQQAVHIVELISGELFKIYSLNTTYTLSLELPLSEACLGKKARQREAIRASALFTCLHVLSKEVGMSLSVHSLLSATEGNSEQFFEPSGDRAGIFVTSDAILLRVFHAIHGYKRSMPLSPYISAMSLFHSQATQTLDGETMNQERSNEDYRQKLESDIKILKTRLQKKNELVESIQKQRDDLTEKNASLQRKLLNMNDKLKRAENENKEILLDLGKLSFEKVAETNKVKQREQFQKLFVAETSSSVFPRNKSTFTCSPGLSPIIPSQASSRQKVETHENRENNGIQPPSLLSSSWTTSREQSVGEIDELAESTSLVGCQNACSVVQTSQDLVPSNESNARSDSVPKLSVQVEEARVNDSISLPMQPASSAGASIFNTYKLLLLTVSSRLLFNDVAKLKMWANRQFSISIDLTASDIVFLLDKKGVINAFDLSQLREFFESISRFDLLYLIDVFQSGNYDSLRNLISANKWKIRENLHASNFRSLLSWPLLPSAPNTNQSPSVSRGTDYSNYASNTGESEEVSTSQSDKDATLGDRSNGWERFDSKLGVSSVNAIVEQTGLSGPGRLDIAYDGFAINSTKEAKKSNAGNNGGKHNASLRHFLTTSGGSNGMKLSKFRRTTSQNSPQSGCRNHDHVHSQNSDQHHGSNNDNDEEDEWLCAHYKRRCFVKFDCCDQFWPCHRCHNNASTCGTKKLKSRDTTMVLCAKCGKEQQFGENGQYCVSCNTKFADFYCGLCKHLTGTDDHPYHCDKCGICRIHGDRSFHCDVCGVCLDVQLQGNHKCRPESAHDECCICLEDAFTGCQILPCSHKVHRNCATEMIRNGITRCPICRESFRHKLQRRPATKKSGKPIGMKDGLQKLKAIRRLKDTSS